VIISPRIRVAQLCPLFCPLWEEAVNIAWSLYLTGNTPAP
jgi:hypothetical protein